MANIQCVKLVQIKSLYSNFNSFHANSPPEVFYKNFLLKNFAILTGKRLCWSLFLIGLHLYSKDTPTQVFCCEYCQIFKDTYFEEHLRMVAFYWIIMRSIEINGNIDMKWVTYRIGFFQFHKQIVS